jgi:hypothetical protein
MTPKEVQHIATIPHEDTVLPMQDLQTCKPTNQEDLQDTNS